MDISLSVMSFPQLKLFSNKEYFGTPCDREMIKFWIDHLTQEKPLCLAFPRLFNLCLYKETSIVSMKRIYNLSQGSALCRRFLRHWEELEADELLKFLTNFSLTNRKDNVIQKVNNSKYRSKDGYKCLEYSSVRDIHNQDWLWRCKVPPKIKIFL